MVTVLVPDEVTVVDSEDVPVDVNDVDAEVDADDVPVVVKLVVADEVAELV